MILDRSYLKYVVDARKSISDVISLLVYSKERIVFCLKGQRVVGSISNGDLLRWLQNKPQVFLDTPCEEIMNKDFVYVTSETPTSKRQELLKRYAYLPYIDEHSGFFLGVLRRRKERESIQIGAFRIAHDSPAFIVAEIGNNHNGSMERGYQLIDAAKSAGANCAKFQMRDLESLYSQYSIGSDASENLGTEYTLDLLKKYQLKNEQMLQLFDYCKKVGIMPLCTPWDLESLAVLENYGMEAYKIASADMTNHDLLRAVAKTGKPMLVSTGMATMTEVEETVVFLQEQAASFIMLHCNSTYPTPFKDVHLSFLNTLKNLTGSIVGYSGHERGIEIPIAAVAMGAKVIEKHITLDKSLEGNDHKVSLLPDEFSNMVAAIRNVELSLGKEDVRELSQGEMINRVNLAKSLVANKEIKKGDMIQEFMIDVKSPGKGLQPNRKSDLIGRPAKRDMQAGDFFYDSDLSLDDFSPREYEFPVSWGIPVRFHDFESLSSQSPVQLVEFHLSYKDMDLNIDKFLKGTYEFDYLVHSPELFSGDHTMDLCAFDDSYRSRSMSELQRVIDLTRKMKSYFPNTKKPQIIVNVGGFTANEPLSEDLKRKKYDILIDSLNRVEKEGVEILPQTMPPYPWHFGGQQFHNLFVDPWEIEKFCQEQNFRICFDISHSKLACNLKRWSFQEFCNLVMPYTAHIHVADARGEDGEGLQIFEGDIDFGAFFKLVSEKNLRCSFIPEIWQGHENSGEGFWIALDRLEKSIDGKLGGEIV